MAVQTAADFRGVSRPAIDRMLRLGQLEEIRIGKTRFVRLTSLVALEDEYEAKVRKVRAFLEGCARERKIVFYEPVMDIVGMKPSVPRDRTAIGQILADISIASWEEQGVTLSVLVHRKSMGVTRPGPGYFDLLEDLEGFPEYRNGEEDQVVERETQRVFAIYAHDNVAV